MQLFFVWLGSKRAAKNGVGREGTLLDLAMRRNLPVPNGGILLDSFYRLCLEEGVAVEQDGRVVIPQVEALRELLFTAVRFPQLEAETTLRTLFSESENSETLLAPQQPAALAHALESAWTMALQQPPPAQHDLLLLNTVTIQQTGIAMMHDDEQDDEVTVLAPDALSVFEQFALPQLQRWGRHKTDGPDYVQRLQMLLRGVRRTFGPEVGKVTWVDDGKICWLLRLD
ncbi:MAG: hypothetical protein AAF614_00470 [Chloroflexota bacterium]